MKSARWREMDGGAGAGAKGVEIVAGRGLL